MTEKYQGFVTIPRDVQTLPIWGNAYDTALWLYCVLHASHQGYKELMPGQFYASQVQIAKVLQCTRKTVSVSLQRLKAKGLLEVETSDTGTIITVNYWDEISSGRGICNGAAMARDVTTGEISRVPEHSRGKPSVEKQAGTPEPAEEPREEQFERFWRAYPKKSYKAEARRMFMKLSIDPEMVIGAIEQAKCTQGWLTENGRYIPNPVKWLDGGWEQFVPAIALNPHPAEKRWTTY